MERQGHRWSSRLTLALICSLAVHVALLVSFTDRQGNTLDAALRPQPLSVRLQGTTAADRAREQEASRAQPSSNPLSSQSQEVAGQPSENAPTGAASRQAVAQPAPAGFAENIRAQTALAPAKTAPEIPPNWQEDRGLPQASVDRNQETQQPQHEARKLVFGWLRTELNRQFQYPPRARRRGWEGTVVLRFAMGMEGRPSSVEVVKSSGHPLLDRDAQATLERIVDTGLPDVPLLLSAIAFELPVTYQLR